MSITVVDQSPNLFWFVSNALIQDTIPLKHIKTAHAAKMHIISESPRIVIINDDDNSINTEDFIKSTKAHLFFGTTQFIVVTGNHSVTNTKNLIMAGASQVLFRARTYDPSSKYLIHLIKWLFNKNDPDGRIFDYKPVPFSTEAEIASFARIRWISSTHCMVDTDLDLKVGQSVDVKNSIFEELGFNGPKFICVEKNKIGRCYDQTNTMLCKLTSNEFEKDQKNLKSWIKSSQKFSFPKKVKVLFFEDDPDLKEQMAKMVSGDIGFIPRGYTDLDNFKNVLNDELPHLVLINRALIQKNKVKFEALRTFVRSNFCYCVTYSNTELFNIDEFKETYQFAMHVPKLVDFHSLDSMIKMLEKKLPEYFGIDDPKFYPSEKSVNSKLSIHGTCRITEMDLSGTTIQLPFNASNFSVCEISSNSFSLAEIGRNQIFRIFNYSSKGNNYRAAILGQNIRATTLLGKALENVSKFGFEKWLNNDMNDEPANK